MRLFGLIVLAFGAAFYAALAPEARADNCYAPASYAQTYYAPAYAQRVYYAPAVSYAPAYAYYGPSYSGSTYYPAGYYRYASGMWYRLINGVAMHEPGQPLALVSPAPAPDVNALAAAILRERLQLQLTPGLLAAVQPAAAPPQQPAVNVTQTAGGLSPEEVALVRQLLQRLAAQAQQQQAPAAPGK